MLLLAFPLGCQLRHQDGGAHELHEGPADIKKVYLINQDYSFGQAVRTAALAMLKAKRPDIEIVGDEVHPLLKVTDFSPYIAKIKASGADTVITGNWGQDFALLLKAAADAGLRLTGTPITPAAPGGPTSIKQTGLDHRVFAIKEGAPNSPLWPRRNGRAFRAKYGVALFYPRAFNEMRMLAGRPTRRSRPMRRDRATSSKA